YGVGYDHVDVDALTRMGIPLATVGDTLSVAVAEHALMLMLAVARQAVVMDRLNRAADYSQRFTRPLHELYGKTVLLVGYGKIGRATARRCAAFEMRVIAAGRPSQKQEIEAEGYGFVSDFRDALPAADFVSLHVPGQPGGAPLITQDELAAMKAGAYLINTSRGSLIDEDALYEALTRGALAGAGLDVTREEPPRRDLPLLELENVVFSPHVAALTRETQSRVSQRCVRNVFDALEGRLDPAMVVNKSVL
ncbi:MAG: 3-phosphoglycerate dehydrogenase, partial [Alphaproteobacteria bacterium]